MPEKNKEPEQQRTLEDSLSKSIFPTSLSQFKEQLFRGQGGISTKNNKQTH